MPIELANLCVGRLQRRYQRFFVDVETDRGLETFHCPNTGSMKSVLEIGQKVLISRNDDPKRKLPGTLEFMETTPGHWALVNTHRSNRLVQEELFMGPRSFLSQGIKTWRPEMPYGSKTRFDFGGVLEDDQGFFVEVKNVTLKLDDGRLSFPDAPSLRALKHLQELAELARQGWDCTLIYLLSRTDHLGFCCQSPYDLKYSDQLKISMSSGLNVILAQINIDVNAQHSALVCISKLESLSHDEN